MHDDNHPNAKQVKMNQGGHIYEKKRKRCTCTIYRPEYDKKINTQESLLILFNAEWVKIE